MSQLMKNGKVFVGCNYWASHAGMFMWSDWNKEVVEADFKRLAENNITVLRVFPLWSDFQPLRLHAKWANTPEEMRLGEDPLPFTEEGKNGIDPLMIDHFQDFADLAKKYGLKLIVGLVTGWMSGRMFAPEAFSGRNLITDPEVVKWQIRFVRYMVRRFKNEEAIVAWDLGNECNCLSQVKNEHESYVWASTITMAIKVEDANHPVLSGMHGLRTEGNWRMEDQGEFLDVFTTHPYPIFVPHCETDPINRMKSALHAAAESQMYADISGKPCFVEEAGTLGPMICSEEIAANYVQSSIFTVWAHNCYGFLWWCANEQSLLEKTPYDWNSVERELGLFRLDGTNKPIADFLNNFTKFEERIGLTLPAQKDDAVCILTKGQDTWAAAYGSFILAKQCGLKLRFTTQAAEIPESDFYFLPSVSGDQVITRHAMVDLLERVKKGASLFISLDDSLLSPFTDITGLQVQTRGVHATNRTVKFAGKTMHVTTKTDLTMKATTAEVLAYSEDGNPFFTVNQYGKGKIYFLNAPIETLTSCTPCILDSEEAEPYYAFYEALQLNHRIAKCADRFVGLTEHELSENSKVLIVINYEPEDKEVEITLADGFKATRVESVLSDVSMETKAGKTILKMSHNTGAVVWIEK